MSTTHVISSEALGSLDPYTRIFMSPLPGNSILVFVSDTAHFVYMGRLAVALTPKYVEFALTTIGAGAQTAEVGLFSTPSPPNKTSQSLTKLVATGTVDDLTTLGVKRNTNAFSTSIAAGTYLWAGIRTAMATTQPRTNGSTSNEDLSEGNCFTCASAGALTGSGPWTGAITALTVRAPVLRVTLD